MDQSGSELLSNFVARNLAKEIETGGFSPGERLSEEAIARRFGVSRGPVREAIRLLAQEELVTLRPRRGAIIPTLTPEEVGEMYEVRAALYSAAVRLMARRVARKEIDVAQLSHLTRMREDLSRMAENPATNAKDFARATQQISGFTIKHCGNRRLQETLGKMTRHSYRYYAEIACRTETHRKAISSMGSVMYTAIMAGEADLAGQITWKIVETNGVAVLAFLDPRDPAGDGKEHHAAE